MLALDQKQRIEELENQPPEVQDDSYLWQPDPRNLPQCNAYNNEADILLYGGTPGGGKTDLGIGLAITKHQRTTIFRRVADDLEGIVERMEELVGSRKGYNGQNRRWRLGDRIIRMGGMKDLETRKKYMGDPNDLFVFDQIEQFLEGQFRYVMTWLRSSRKGQRKRIVCTSNPPDSDDGRWILEFWGAWLNPNHHNPAKAGELRWYCVMDGKDQEVPGGREFILKKDKFVYDFDREKVKSEDIFQPMSRTFIPATSEDNPYYDDDYKAVLKNLPEPYRSMMLLGDYMAAFAEDNPFQVFPTAWVDAAMERWKMTAKPTCAMSSIGCDPSRGGRDKTILAPRYQFWFDKLIKIAGIECKDGPTVAAACIEHRGSQAIINLDICGIGGSVLDCLTDIPNVPVNAINGAEKRDPDARDKSGRLKFLNDRSMFYWSLREALDPDNGLDICLPPDEELRKQMLEPHWKLSKGGIQIESKQDMIKRLGHSPDECDGVVYAWGAGQMANLSEAQFHETSVNITSDADDEPYPWDL